MINVAGHILFESSLGDKDYVSENIYVDEYCQSDDGTCSEKISGVQFVSSCSDDVVVSCKEIASSSYDDYVRTPCDQITPDDDKLSNESKTKRMSVVVDSGNELLELQRLRRLLHCARLKLYRLKKKEADRRMNPEKVSVKKFLEMGEIFFSEPAFTFLKYLVKVSSNSGKQSQWTKEYKMLALSIYHTSSKAYILLKNVLSLPSIRTLQRLKRDL